MSQTTAEYGIQTVRNPTLPDNKVKEEREGIDRSVFTSNLIGQLIFHVG